MADFGVMYAQRQMSIAKSSFDGKDREAISKFLNHVHAQGVSERRLVKYAGHFMKLQGLLRGSLTEISHDQLDHLLIDINRHAEWSAWTKHDYLVCLKKFFRYYDNSEVRAGRIRISTPSPKVIDENECLTEDDIDALLAAARNLQAKTIVRFLFDSAASEMEFLKMRIKDVTEQPPFLVFHLPGTKNQYRDRKIPIMSLNPDSILLFSQYLNAHPHRDDPNALLWISFSGLPMEPRNLDKSLRKLATWASIEKRVNPQWFRHSKITQLTNLGVPEPMIKIYAGWSKSSKMMATYSHSGINALKDALLKVRPESGEEKSQRVSVEIADVILKSPELMHQIVKELQRKGKLGVLKDVDAQKRALTPKVGRPDREMKERSKRLVTHSKFLTGKKGGRRK